VSAHVLDASVVPSWCFPDEATEPGWLLLERTIEHGAIVPSHWALEVANAFVVGERRGRIAPEVAAEFLPGLARLPIEMDVLTHARATFETLELARSNELSSYDAAYLELARRKGLPLATRDRRLADAASAEGIETIRP
jgi:predicted nucleic acid-binding protein